MTNPILVDCARCGGSGFSSPGTGYGDVCSECGGLRVVPAQLHPNTRQLVDEFSKSLTAKLAKAEQKYGYRDNWLTDDWEADCRAELMRHLEKGDPLDVAAYCAFMWKRGWSTN